MSKLGERWAASTARTSGSSSAIKTRGGAGAAVVGSGIGQP
jgi:hypothetical protein